MQELAQDYYHQQVGKKKKKNIIKITKIDCKNKHKINIDNIKEISEGDEQKLKKYLKKTIKQKKYNKKTLYFLYIV